MSNSNAHITEDQKDQIRELYLGGMSGVKIAEQIGISKSACYYHIKAMDLPSVRDDINARVSKKLMAQTSQDLLKSFNKTVYVFQKIIDYYYSRLIAAEAAGKGDEYIASLSDDDYAKFNKAQEHVQKNMRVITDAEQIKVRQQSLEKASVVEVVFKDGYVPAMLEDDRFNLDIVDNVGPDDLQGVDADD